MHVCGQAQIAKWHLPSLNQRLCINKVLTADLREASVTVYYGLPDESCFFGVGVVKCISGVIPKCNF